MSDSTPTPPGPGYGQAPTGVDQPADLLMRFLARLIDFVLIGIVSGLIGLVVGRLLGLSIRSYGMSMSAGLAAGVFSAVITAALYLGYFTVMESRSGQTLGKMLLKLRTVGPDGGIPTTEQALRRNAWTGLSILGIVPIIGPLVGSILQLVAEIMIAVTISQSPVKEGWHDRFAGGTRVVRSG